MRRKIVELPRAERRRGLLHLAVELHEHRLHRAHDERQRHEEQREHDRRPGVGHVDADRALGPYSASSVRPATIVGQRERQVDERVDEALAAGTRRGPAPRPMSVPITALIERHDQRGDRA